MLIYGFQPLKCRVYGYGNMRTCNDVGDVVTLVLGRVLTVGERLQLTDNENLPPPHTFFNIQAQLFTTGGEGTVNKRHGGLYGKRIILFKNTCRN